jgi:hypothetical protein
MKFKYFDPIVCLITLMVLASTYYMFQTWIAVVIAFLLMVIGHDWDYIIQLKKEITSLRYDLGKERQTGPWDD